MGKTRLRKPQSERSFIRQRPISQQGATRHGPKFGLGRVPKEGDSCRAHAQIPITGHKRKSLSLSSPVSLTADTFKASAQPLVCPGASGSRITMCGGGGSPVTMWYAKSPVQVRQWSWCSLRKCTLAALAYVFCLCSDLSRNTLKSQAAPKSPCTPHKNTCSSNPLMLHPGKRSKICKRPFPMLPWKKCVHDSCTTWTSRMPAMQC